MKDNVGNVQATGKTAAITLDTVATTTTAGPSVSGTTDTATTLSATLNENGTGYYLVQAFAAAAPDVAAVQAGTSFAMTANVAATPAIGGLTAATAYKIYFVAKDAANNVQAAVQSVAVTTATPDTIPEAFAFVDQTNVARSSLTESAAITVAGINAASAITVVGGEYQINAGAWTAVAGTVTNGQTVKLRHTSSAGDATATNTTLTMGGVSDTFTTTTLPAGYVSQGGLTWMPNNVVNPPNGWDTWTNANAYCTGTTINGQTGWRLPTAAELSALYASGAMNGQGWALANTWSSTPSGAGYHETVDLNGGDVLWGIDTFGFNYVTCVR